MNVRVTISRRRFFQSATAAAAGASLGVRVRLPEGVQPKRVHLLASGQSPRVQREGLVLTLTVPGILDHEVVAIDF